jgi:hypothetical protein
MRGVERLYFELFLSGDGPSILRRYNYESLPCHKILDSSMAPAYLKERLAGRSKVHDYRFELEVESLSATHPIDTARLAKALLPMRFRLANCLADRQGAMEAKVQASWKLSPFGSVDGLELTVTEGPDRSVRSCLTSLLEDWRFGEASDHQTGSVEARLRLALRSPNGR